MQRHLGVSPAYGRDYKTAGEVRKAYDEGHDFMIHDMTHRDYGRYVGKNGHPEGVSLFVRHHNGTRVTVIAPPSTNKWHDDYPQQ